eukprot:737676-Ditylum_brightwellii.AAC.1
MQGKPQSVNKDGRTKGGEGNQEGGMPPTQKDIPVELLDPVDNWEEALETEEEHMNKEKEHNLAAAEAAFQAALKTEEEKMNIEQWKKVDHKRHNTMSSLARAASQTLEVKKLTKIRVNTGGEDKGNLVMLNNLTVQEKMQMQGAVAIDLHCQYKTPVTIKFDVFNPREMFPLRQKLAECFRHIQLVDESAKIKETIGETMWTSPKDLPTVQEFHEVFKARKTTIKCQPKVVVCCTILSNVKLDDLKFDGEKGSAGFFTELLLDLMCKDDLVMEIHGQLLNVRLEHREINPNERGEALLMDMCKW